MKNVITTLILGALLAEYGFAGLHQDGSMPDSPERQADIVMERIIPLGEHDATIGMSVVDHFEISADVDAGIRLLDNSVRQVPGYAIKIASQVEQHGIAALAYENPELKRSGQELGHEIGQGIRHMAIALAKDLILSARDSGVGVQFR